MEKPKIRFKGYQEDWEQRKLGDFGKATGGTSIESEFSEDGIYKVISIGSYSENGVYNDQGIRAIKSDKTSNRVLNRNDLTMILNDKTTSGNIIGRVLLIEESGIYVYNQRTERIEINLDEYDPVFLYEMLNAPNIREKIIKQAQGNTQIYVNWIAISLLEYMIPSKEEQVKIGEYLHSISNLITLHQRKCEEMKTLKKYMLQKMFPQNGQSVPQIRFSGFTEDWEQRKLGDITVKIGSGKTPSGGKSAYVETGIPLIRSQNVNGDKVDFADIVFIDEATDESMANSRVYTNDVLLNITGASIGRSAVYKGLESANVNQHVCIIRPTEGYQPDFIQLNLSSDNGQKQIDASQAGGGREGLNFQEIGKIQFYFPSLNEQKCIGRYFNSLDHLITLHQQKCDELRNIKKFMLQNMFI